MAEKLSTGDAMRMGRKIDVLQDQIQALSEQLVENSRNLGSVVLRMTEYQDELAQQQDELRTQNNAFLNSVTNSLAHHQADLATLRQETQGLITAVKESQQHFRGLATFKIMKALPWVVALAVMAWFAGTWWESRQQRNYLKLFREVAVHHEDELLQIMAIEKAGYEADVLVIRKGAEE